MQGDFHCGVMHGQGRYTWKDGVVYEVGSVWWMWVWCVEDVGVVDVGVVGVWDELIQQSGICCGVWMKLE